MVPRQFSQKAEPHGITELRPFSGTNMSIRTHVLLATVACKFRRAASERWVLSAKMKASWFKSQYLRLLDSHILFDARLPSFFLKLMMIGDAVWRVVVTSFHNFSSACRCQMLTSFRPLVRCSKIAFQHFPTAVWAETCSQRCCHHRHYLLFFFICHIVTKNIYNNQLII